jgi:hypothetical protein
VYTCGISASCELEETRSLEPLTTVPDRLRATLTVAQLSRTSRSSSAAPRSSAARRARLAPTSAGTNRRRNVKSDVRRERLGPREKSAVAVACNTRTRKLVLEAHPHELTI